MYTCFSLYVTLIYLLVGGHIIRVMFIFINFNNIAIKNKVVQGFENAPKVVFSTTGCSLNIGFFPRRILEGLPTLPRHHSAAIGCTKNYQPIGVTEHSHCVKSFEGFFTAM